MIQIDMDADQVIVNGSDGSVTYPIGSSEAFAIISQIWLRCGWDTKYVYSFSWMGRPVIQLPEDMIRIQEAIYQIKPDVIIETGIAHGGSLIYYASLFKAMGKGRVIGVDIEIRPHNRQAIEAHELCSYITMIEGSSIAPDIVSQVKAQIKPGEIVMVILDSNHTKAHVLAELEAYASVVTPNSYIVATDGIMAEVVGAPRTREDWSWNNPKMAALEFVANNPDYVIKQPTPPFNEGLINQPVTYWPSAWILRK